ncbi:MAG TPA: putative toxin-antitoxin system toxin component, PIN family [Longimicrobiaceae bacterium]|nr:putative toxin-antitoxin system toxin component, PIN family [Longimicrobiaceae bacterium]
MRVFLDTNVLVSAFATRGICEDVLNVVLTEHQLVLGEAVLTEFRRVLDKKMRMHLELADEAVAFLRREAIIVPSAPALPIELRDADDVMVLSEAVAGLAEVVVTGDRDILDVAETLPVPAVSPRGFWEMLHGKTGA